MFANNYAREMMRKHFKIENIIRIHIDSCTIINQEIRKELLTEIGNVKIYKLKLT